LILSLYSHPWVITVQVSYHSTIWTVSGYIVALYMVTVIGAGAGAGSAAAALLLSIIVVLIIIAV